MNPNRPSKKRQVYSFDQILAFCITFLVVFSIGALLSWSTFTRPDFWNVFDVNYKPKPNENLMFGFAIAVGMIGCLVTIPFIAAYLVAHHFGLQTVHLQFPPEITLLLERSGIVEGQSHPSGMVTVRLRKGLKTLYFERQGKALSTKIYGIYANPQWMTIDEDRLTEIETNSS